MFGDIGFLEMWLLILSMIIGPTLIVVFVFAIAIFFVWYLTKNDNNKNNEDELAAYFSDEATSHKFKLEYEFERLVIEIAHHNTRANAKLRLIKDGELKEKVLISPEDMDAAFLEAVKELYLPPLYSRRDNWDFLPLLEKIRAIRKLYEPKTP